MRIAAALLLLAASLSFAQAPLDFTPATMPDAYNGVPYSQSLVPAGGVPPYVFRIEQGSRPYGMDVSSSGVFFGTPLMAGTWQLGIQLKDSAGAAILKQVTITVRPPLELVYAQLPDATQGEAYAARITASGGAPPYTYRVTSGRLPAGLTLAPSGALAGTPRDAGAFGFTVEASDANRRTVSSGFGLAVWPALDIQPAVLPEAVPYYDYRVELRPVGGKPDYSWKLSAGRLPEGLLFNAGVIRGAAVRSGRFTFDITLTDSRQRSRTRRYNLIVGSTPTLRMEGRAPRMEAGVPVLFLFRVDGGRPPYRWSYVGLLPDGLDLSPVGLLYGRPMVTGEFPITIRVEDADNQVASAPSRLQVALAPVPPASITGVPSTLGPAGQSSFALNLALPYPMPIDGTITLDFKPDSGPGDPAVQFATGGRIIEFEIPAGATRANLDVPRNLFQSGTTAGTITLTADLKVLGTSVNPKSPVSTTTKIAAAPPLITRIDLNHVGDLWELVVIGYSTPRNMQSLKVHFDGKPDATIDVSQWFANWYASPDSAAYGTQFRYSQWIYPAGARSITVSAVNSAGASAPVTAFFAANPAP